MFDITKKQLLALFLSSGISSIGFAHSPQTSITLEQITEDVNYLASDSLNGRGNFSQDIHQAADYIAKRFKEVGLVPVEGNDGFFQRYQVKRLQPNNLQVSINGKAFTADKLAIANTSEKISLSEKSTSKGIAKVNVVTIGKNDDFRTILSTLNAEGGHHLVLLHSSHQALFLRYQHYFAQGLTKLINNDEQSTKGGSITIALTNISANDIESFSINASSLITTTELTNVVAVLPGKKSPDEYVLYSAHYDHLGSTNDSGDSDTIYNGADDNASGTTGIINLAQHFANQGNNNRSLLFAAFSAEEIGGFGSKYFSTQLDPNDITAMVNIEMIGKPSKFGAGTMWMTGMKRSNLGEQLNIALEKSGMEIYQDPYPEQRLFYRSDNATLARLGVPAHSFSSTQLDKDEYYHKVTDDISSLDLASMHKVINALAIATQPLADGIITPSRIDTNLVKKKGLIY